MPEQKGLILRRRTSTSSHNDDWFCIFSDPALENIGIPTNEEVVEMQTDTATALADELAAVNKLCPERGSAVDKVTGKHTYKTCNRVYASTAKTLSPQHSQTSDINGLIV
ncbi:hypothetical protein HBH77_096020 [Parastagonospora nodorum]|nr:hypothetical protein HBH77_096020 [Parastagonospora nodorum]